MASTNKTTNYELSQYIGSDKPTYLGDYNSDMLKIDTQMKRNADDISSVGATSTTASQTANTALTNANNAQNTAESAQGTASTANNTANTALTKANANEVKINTVEQRFNLNTITPIQASAISGSGTGFKSIGGSKLRLATNSENSIFKIYGRLVVLANASGGSCSCSFATPLRPTTPYSIQTAGVNLQGAFSREVNIAIATDGKMTITSDLNRSENNILYIFPCLYFNNDFGDEPEE